MTPLDDLFSTDESRAESRLEKVVTLNPAEISDFPNHPFKVKQDDAMIEMVAGHRRKFAEALAELTEIPCIVRNLTDDEAGRYEKARSEVGFNFAPTGAEVKR